MKKLLQKLMGKVNKQDLKAILLNEFTELEKDAFEHNSNFKEVINCNSMNSLIFIVCIDSEYEISLTESQLKKIDTLDQLVNLLNERASYN